MGDQRRTNFPNILQRPGKTGYSFIPAAKLALPLWLAILSTVALMQWYSTRVTFDIAGFVEPSALPELYRDLVVTIAIHASLLALLPMAVACAVRPWFGWLLSVGFVLVYGSWLYEIRASVIEWPVLVGAGVGVALLVQRAWATIRR